MTEFTFAPGEKNIIGDRFSPSVIIFWLKTSIAASSTRIQYTTPNTLFGLIPLGADTKTIPLRNVASVDTSTKFNLGSPVWGVVFLLIGLGCLDSSVAVALVLILVAASNLANTMSAQLDFVNQAGGRNSVKVSILEKDKLMQLAQNIQRLVFADVEGQRHQESMDMAQKQYTAQTRSVLARHQLHQTDVRIREIKHEMMHPLHHAAQQHVDLAEIGLRLARMPYQIHERLITLRRELTPEPRHRPRHRGQGDLRAMLVPQPLPDPGRGMPLLAPVRAILREPLLDHGQIRVDHRRARLSHRRHGRQILLREVLTHRRLADMCFPRDRRDGFPVPPQTTDRLYLGHADHNPFRSFLAEIQAPSS